MDQFNCEEQQSVLRLLVEKDALLKQNEEYEEVLRSIISRFYSVGGALNDNVLQYNKQQMLELFEIAEEIKFVLPSKNN